MTRPGTWQGTIAGLAAVLGLLAAVSAALTTPAAASGGWTLDHADDDPIPQGQLSAVSCPTAGWCVAVGTSDDAKGLLGPIVETWNGTIWQHQPMPNPAGSRQTTLDGVSCTSPTQCSAVGYALVPGGFVGFSDAWDGSTWTVQMMPDPKKGDTNIFGVSCSSSTACTAVGDFATASTPPSPLIEQWNGTAWQVEAGATPPSGIGADLNSVSCTSAAVCTAVGVYNTRASDESAWAESSSAGGWTAEVVSAPAGSQSSSLASVSCADATTCTGAGTSTNGDGNAVTEIAQWNGTVWTLPSAPDPAGNSSLVGVSCSSPTACSAVGSSETNEVSSTFAERWDGTTWAVETTPDPGAGSGDDTFDGASCPTATSCEAVGSVAANRDTSFADGWDGTSWTLQKTPEALGVPGYRSLAGVSCVSATFCVAVGHALSPVQQWNGTNWAVVPTPNPPKQATYTAVSCSSATACTVIGFWEHHSTVFPFAERWNGSTWVLQTVPSIPKAVQSRLLAVSCPTATSCTAVGSYETHGPEAQRTFTLADSWNGSTWTVRSSPTPSRRRVRATLFGVSCTSSTACTAVGQIWTSAGIGALAEGWNGTRWSIQTTVDPSNNTVLQGVSCTSAVSCVAVGGSTTQGKPTVTLAEGWNGTTWAVQPTPTPTKNNGYLTGVSCLSATACTAVGANSTPSTSTTDALAWDGTTWNQQITPTLPDNLQSSFTGLSCTAPATCTAVGSRQTSHSTQLNLVESEQG